LTVHLTQCIELGEENSPFHLVCPSEFAESPEKKLNPTVHKATELIAATGLLWYVWRLFLNYFSAVGA
jgi:hypothetical protein